LAGAAGGLTSGESSAMRPSSSKIRDRLGVRPDTPRSEDPKQVGRGPDLTENLYVY
jgi:hypothetical protein